MTFARKNALGWGFGDKVSHGDLTAIDLDTSRAVDGYAGGNYTPSAKIDVAGSGLRCDMAGASTCPSGASLAFASGSTLTSAGKVALGGAATPSSNGETNFGGTARILSGATLSVVSGGTLSTASGATCTFASAVTCSGALAINAASTITAPLVATSAGRVVKRLHNLTFVSNAATASVATGDVLVCPLLSAGTYLTMSNSGALEGDVVRIACPDNDGGFHLYVEQAAGSPTIVSLLQEWVDIVFDGSLWVAVGRGAF